MGQDDGRDDEINALMQAEGVDSAKIAEQVAKKSGKPVDEKPPDDKKPDEKKPDEKKPDEKKDVPNPETIKADMLHEMWGDQFKTVEDFKKANIPGQLQELTTLRQKNKDLETQLQTRPKHHYASDEIAKYDEFVRQTKIEDVRVYDKIKNADLANMQDMDALILQHIIDNPSLASKEPQVRKYFETKYNVDSKKVEAGDLTQDELEANLIGVASDGAKAKVRLQELKSKIKMPEIPAEKPDDTTKKWTPEIETQQKASWEKINKSMLGEFSNLPITIEGFKEPILNFELPEESKSVIMKNALDYVVSNQMEVNEANVKIVAQSMYSDIQDSNRQKIYHAIFERARSMTEKEYMEKYHNPSKKNNDTPPGGAQEESDEAKKEKAYRAEMER